MKLSQILGKDKITLSFEVFPPKTEANYEAVKKAALDVAALNPSYMSVTYGAGGSTRANTVQIASAIQQQYGITAISHLTCVGATKEDIDHTLDSMKEAGIENVLALRGDRPKDFEGEPFTDFHYASELVEHIKARGDFCVGGACYPEGHVDAHNKKEDITYLKKKVDAGCDYLTTQMFFDNNIYYNFLYRVSLYVSGNEHAGKIPKSGGLLRGQSKSDAAGRNCLCDRSDHRFDRKWNP